MPSEGRHLACSGRQSTINYKLLLDALAVLELLAFAANCFARAGVPISVILTRIAAGAVFRGLVSRALARAFAHALDKAMPMPVRLEHPSGNG